MVELNIRLDVIGRRFSDAQFERRAKSVVGVLSKIGTLEHRVRRIWRDQPRHLVAQIHVEEIADSKLYKIAEKYQQDCVSIYSPTRNEGRLVGPKAEKWPAFNLEKFERYDDSLSLRHALHARKKYVPPSDPAVLAAQMDAARSRYRQVFTTEVLHGFAPQQMNLTNNAIHQILEEEGPDALTVPRFEGIYELVTGHLWSPAFTAVFNTNNQTGVMQ